MNNRRTRALMITSLWLVGFHFLVVVAHSVAHEILAVKATPAQLAFIVPVIIFGPVISGFVLLKFERAGAALLLASMVGSFASGLYYHFVADTIDHVAHVARMQPAFTRVVELNGLYAVSTEREDAPPGFAGKLATLFQLNDEGLIERVYFVMATRKLTALPAMDVAEAEEGR